MKTLLITVMAVASLCFPATAQNAKAFLGRWDFTVTPTSGAPYPQWMELLERDGKIEGRVQPRGGGWRPILGAKLESGKLAVAISAGKKGPNVNWELTASSPDQLNGVEKLGDADGPRLAGVRAPKLDRPMPKAWGEPKPIFNGRDLSGWEGSPKDWKVEDGYLTGTTCGQPPGATSSVNGARGSVMANSLTVALSPGGNLCITALVASHTLFDTTGWWMP